MAMDDNLKELREQALALGLKPHHKANAKTIQAAINAHIVAITQEDSVVKTVNTVEKFTENVPVYEPPLSQTEFNKTQAALENRLSGSLVRVRIQNMNPQKKEWPGEIISVGSAKLGTFKKFIPFNTGEPYHIPRIIYNVLKDKKCSQFYTVDDGKGHKRRKSKLIDEYVLEELPPLTPQELKDLALKQAMAQGKEG